MKKQLCTLILSRSKVRYNQGFTMFEVLIAIFVSSAFLMGTLQAMTINTFLQVKAERETKANFWIQEDLDTVYAAASAMPSNNDICKNTPPTVDNRFGAALKDKLNSLSTVEPQDFQQYEMDSKGNHQFDTSGQASFVTVQDSRDSTITKQATVQVIRDQDLVNTPYRLVRIITLDSATNYDILQVHYRVGEPHVPDKTQDIDNDQLADDERGKTSIIAQNYTEIIPAAVSACTL
ncbi:MAG: prepilin-type N-terminal cleavage/methylation domain-containing protein [Cyanobacteria bacterium P01_G01_bin.49]